MPSGFCFRPHASTCTSDGQARQAPLESEGCVTQGFDALHEGVSQGTLLSQYHPRPYILPRTTNTSCLAGHMHAHCNLVKLHVCHNDLTGQLHAHIHAAYLIHAASNGPGPRELQADVARRCLPEGERVGSHHLLIRVAVASIPNARETRQDGAGARHNPMTRTSHTRHFCIRDACFRKPACTDLDPRSHLWLAACWLACSCCYSHSRARAEASPAGRGRNGQEARR